MSRQHSNGGNIRSYHHLTTFERVRIQELLSQGYSHWRIAQKLYRHRYCIDREIRRNATRTGYVCVTAPSAYDTRRIYSKPNGKCTTDLVDIITDRLLATWSPEQIANTVHQQLLALKPFIIGSTPEFRPQ
ncbi:helix-turn-helix domain-containing protein [Oscillospiraceae bacterium PP1C4]